jgi:uncharacterized protein YciI
MQSISMSKRPGQAGTLTKIRAGGSLGKYLEYLYETNTQQLAESMMTNDPYFVGGAIASYRITAWEVHGANPSLLRVSK